MTRRSDIIGHLPQLLGLSHDEAAAYVGISGTSFDKLVHEGKMPLPREVSGRRIWDIDELRAAFKALPHEGEQAGRMSSWADRRSQ